MTHNLATYLALPGNTKEAMTHWQEVFGGELQLLTYAQTGFDMPAISQDAIAHSTLTTPGGTIAAGDAIPEEHSNPIRDTVYSLLYTTDTPDEARDLIAKLVAGGGDEGMPFAQAPWGGYYGQVFDRFGVMWAFSCE
ncbi:VOC family protein [Gordonia amarae]|uniref:Glyoxalase/fosfomycin resistance/dioxygenase domain-containing protein n=2 Tax=Gordonia amarae TaxID=36821 RepID=G7GTB5_9ACTN|nr:VOC family protein [Gordonia amarae]MCS3880034.1 PhnB protein [Gordonia amarae]QHN18415.1 VOC family protein [Gordonia amarae]QHN22897.1 VOC family protein [Gordonia amarae]QHN31800.1 VOC family protein [Gordonia amarae]QHN40546.1 VOC family protein [Gordonia amarae]